jgi:anti-anti-sigma regulatory factor/HAMP domain-containing protein
MRLARWSLATQLLFLVGSVLLLTTALVLFLAIVQARSVIEDDVTRRNAVLTDAASQLLAVPLATSDRAGVERTLTEVVRDEGLDRASVLDAAGTLVATSGEAAPEDPADFAHDLDFARVAMHDNQRRSRSTEEHFDLAVPITQDGRTLGIVVGESDFEVAADKVDAVIPQMIAISLLVTLLGGVLVWMIARYFARPVRDLALAATAIGQGHLDAPVPIRRGGEIGALAAAFQQMVADLRSARAEVLEQHNSLEVRVTERTIDLERALTELHAALSAREQLSTSIRALASPVVPVLEGILVMPLIGVVDSERATLLLDSLLKAIEQHRAHMVIMDVTGVPLIDTQVARVLLQAIDAAQLLGAQTVVVGIRPELAQTIVGLGVNLDHVVTHADLQSAVSYAMQSAHTKMWNETGHANAGHTRN